MASARTWGQKRQEREVAKEQRLASVGPKRKRERSDVAPSQPSPSSNREAVPGDGDDALTAAEPGLEDDESSSHSETESHLSIDADAHAVCTEEYVDASAPPVNTRSRLQGA